MAVKLNSYVNIQAFMVNELGLSGNELIIYAVIHGFSQDGESWFTGSRGYLAEWCQTSKKTISNNLAKLCEKGFLEKRTRIENGVTFNDYRAAKDFTGVGKIFPQGGEEISTGGGEKTSLHTIELDTTRRNTREKRFNPPTVIEVDAYCRERQNGINAQQFCDFYASKGWRVGNQPMRDWKAAVRTWEQRNGRRGRNGVKIAPPKQDDISLEGIF